MINLLNMTSKWNLWNWNYCKVSDIRRALGGNKIVDLYMGKYIGTTDSPIIHKMVMNSQQIVQTRNGSVEKYLHH